MGKTLTIQEKVRIMRELKGVKQVTMGKDLGIT